MKRALYAQGVFLRAEGDANLVGQLYVHATQDAATAGELARKMAAAEELYEALEHVANAAEEITDADLVRIRAALQKARGGTPCPGEGGSARSSWRCAQLKGHAGECHPVPPAEGSR